MQATEKRVESRSAREGGIREMSGARSVVLLPTGERMKRHFYGIVGLFCAIASATAQSTEPLEQQLRELKQQYTETTRAMEQRI